MRPSAACLALAEEERVAEVDPAGQLGQPGRAHDGRAASRQDAFVVVGMRPEERLGDDQVDDRVTEVLEALVVARRRSRCSWR